MTQNQVNSLRDLALEHLPEVKALSKELYLKHRDSRAALQVVAFAPDAVVNSPLSTSAQKLAGQLLHLVGQHPETLIEHLIDKPNDGSIGITTEDAHRWAMRDRPNTETLLIETARSLCEISGASLPPWVQADNKEAVPATDTETPEILKTGRSMKVSALIAEFEFEWSSVRGDIEEAKRNGLKEAAHSGKHGMYDCEKARAWAVSMGKIKSDKRAHSLTGAWSGTVIRNKIADE